MNDNDDILRADDQDAFDAWLKSRAPALNAPGRAPREEMWAAIQAAQATSLDAQAGTIPGVKPLRRSPWRLMSLIAAALLLGVAIDRVMLRPTEKVAAPVALVPAAPDSADPSRLYRMAAAQTLTQAEALLTAYRANGPDERAALGGEQLAKWGGEVLGSTRLLIDSPAGSDPQLRALLEDLELVLVQLIQLSRGPVDPSDREHVNRALEGSDLLPRIRTAVPAGTPVSASSD